MRLVLFIGLAIFAFEQTIPFKPKEEFEIKLQYEFRQRSTLDNSSNAVHFNESAKDHEKRTSAANLPYLTINLHVLKLNPEEVRMRIVDNFSKVVYNKKVKPADVVTLSLGFTVDMKDRVTAHEYAVAFQSDEKKDLSRILITVNQDGSFFVNEEKRGKF
jgi:hypothetical protein